MKRRRAAIMTPALVLFALAAVVLGVLGGLYYLDTHPTYYSTDDNAIHQDADTSQTRDVLWEPAQPLSLAGIESTDQYEPKLSPDGNTLFLVRGKPGENADIFLSHRTLDGWTTPQAFDEINSPADDLGPSPTPDGNAIYFYSNRAGSLGGYDIWFIERGEESWLEPVNLGDAVNSPFNDYGPAIDSNSTTLYFASNRPRVTENTPDPDRWRATLREDLFANDYDLYSAPIVDAVPGNASPMHALNSDRNEGAPAVSPFNDFLYFASDRPGGQGGYDIYRARRSSEQWLPPATLGNSINSVANDLDPTVGMGGFQLFFSSDRSPPAADAADETPQEFTYDLYTSMSREVFTQRVTAQASFDWLPILTNLLWLLLLLLLLLALLMLLRHLAAGGRLGKLSLLSKMLILALLLHAALMFLKITNTLGPGFNRTGGTQVQLTTSADADPLASQIRGNLTDLARNTPDTPASVELPLLVQLDAQSQAAELVTQQHQAAAPEQLAVHDANDAQAPEFTQIASVDEPLPEQQVDADVSTPAAQKLARTAEAALELDVQQTLTTSAAPTPTDAHVQAVLVDASGTLAPVASEQLALPVPLHDAVPTVDVRASSPQEQIVESPVATSVASPRDANRQQSQETSLAVRAQPTDATPAAPLLDNATPTRAALLDAATTAQPQRQQMASSAASDSAPSTAVSSAIPAVPLEDVPNQINTAVATPGQPQRANAQEATLDRIDVDLPISPSAAPLLAQLTPTDTSMPQLPIEAARTNANSSSLARNPSNETTDARSPALALDAALDSNQPIDIPDDDATFAVATPTERASQESTSESTLAARAPSEQHLQTLAPAASPTPVETNRIELSVDSQQPMRPDATLAPTDTLPQDAQLLPMPGILADLPESAINLPLDDIALRDIPLASLPDLPSGQHATEETDAPRVIAANIAPATGSPAVPIDVPELAITDTFTPHQDTPQAATSTAFDLAHTSLDASNPALAVVAATPDAIDVSFPILPDDSFALPSELTPPNEEYAQRDEDVREKVVEEMGGSEETEEAVQLALAWLARVQSDDGRWDTDGFDDGCFDCPDATSDISSDIALTGLALLCFQGAGYTHIHPGPYRDTVERGVQFLLRAQSSSGDLRAGETMYSHGIATIALAEALGMTSDELLRDPVERAVAFIIGARNRATRAPIGNRRAVGGWRYAPGQVGDTSVLGWQVMALKSATRAGIEIPQQIFDYAGHWLDQVQIEGNDGLYAYQPGDPPTFSMTAEAMFVRQLLGAMPDEARMHRSVAFLLEEEPVWDNRANTYGWYYATLALFQHQGEAWNAWNQHIKDVIVEAQIAQGPAIGSWPTQDRWSRIGGRIYQTAICTLSLEVYYRYLPRFLNDVEDAQQPINAGE